jgi:hypothetical protein
MKLRPNKSLIEATVKRVTRAADGVGADVVVDVRACTSAGDHDDFIGAKPGAELTLFTAEPDAIEAGKSYRLTARVLGGPTGERLIVEAAEPKKTAPKKTR